MSDTFTRLGREFLTDAFGVDCSHLPHAKVYEGIEKIYLGGWEAFVRVMRHSLRDELPREDTPIQAWTRARRIVGDHGHAFRLRPYDTVVSCTITDNEIKALVEVHIVAVHKRRDKIVKSGKRLHVWKRVDSDDPTVAPWQHDEMTVWGKGATEVITQGRAATAEYVADQLDQYETCFRPGTHKSPMAGAVARAELSHEQYWGDEAFQSPEEA